MERTEKSLNDHLHVQKVPLILGVHNEANDTTFSFVPSLCVYHYHHAILEPHEHFRRNDVIDCGFALQLAFCTANQHAGSEVEVLSMDDVSFAHPVPIGCLVKFEAKVVYVQGSVMRVAVWASKAALTATDDFSVANVFNFAFKTLRNVNVVPVVPDTLAEAVEYLQGHRLHTRDQSMD